MFRRIQGDLQTRLFLFTFLLVLAVIIIFLDRANTLRPVQQVLGAFTEPVERSTYNLGRNLSELTVFLDNLDKLKSENRLLRDQLQNIQEQQARSADIASQLFELEKELAFKRNLDNRRFQTISGDVVNRDVTSLNQAIEVNRGSDDNVKVGMIVLDSSGFLVGRIAKVTAKRSTILLVTDTNMAANVMNKRFGQDGKQIGISKGADGTAIGQWQVGGRITIFRIQNDADIQVGDFIFTDGKGGTFPANVLVGLVSKVNAPPGEPDKQAELNPASDLERLQRVQIVLATNDS